MIAVECGSGAAEASTSLILLSMDSILRQLEGLSRHELVWLNTYLTGRLRALPPTMGPQPTVSNPACLGGKGERVNPVPAPSPATPLPDQWTLGNAQVLLLKAGRLTYNSRSCLSKGISSQGLVI